jgi:hypothetical protein
MNRLSLSLYCALVLLFTICTPCLAGASAQAEASSWEALQPSSCQASLWQLGLDPAQLLKQAQQRNGIAPLHHPSAQSQARPKASNSIQAKMWQRRMLLEGKAPQEKPAPQTEGVFGEIQDRSLNWHSPSAMNSIDCERIFDDKRHTFSGMAGYTDDQIKMGLGPEFTIDTGAWSKSAISHGTDPIDVGLGMRLEMIF